MTEQDPPTVSFTMSLLREPFPRERIGKLPRVTCGDCRDSRARVCDRHAKARCSDCGSWITGAHTHLDYVGHADVTDRLLNVDPEWSWEPFALAPNGLPAFDEHGGMWIRLTVAGVTRVGYGDADGKRGGDAVKETIGNAIRITAMRFGVALDLWRKELPADDDQSPLPRPAASRPVQPSPAFRDSVILYDSFLQKIREAETVDLVRSIGSQAWTAFRDEKLNEAQYNALQRDGLKKIEKLEQKK